MKHQLLVIAQLTRLKQLTVTAFYCAHNSEDPVQGLCILLYVPKCHNEFGPGTE